MFYHGETYEINCFQLFLCLNLANRNLIHYIINTQKAAALNLGVELLQNVFVTTSWLKILGNVVLERCLTHLVIFSIM